jgi:hypothetical protein
VLETKQEGEENGDLIIETIEWSFIVLVFPIERPYVWCDKVDIVLWVCQNDA